LRNALLADRHYLITGERGVGKTVFLETLLQRAQRRFATEASERLRPSAPGSPHARLVLYGEPWWWAAAGGLYETVMTGAPAFDRIHGAALFDWLQEHPEAGATFDAHMTAMTGGEAEAVVAVAELPQSGTVVDVGGGRGTLLAAILRAHPRLRGVLFDQPHVVADANLPERCEAVAGSFFELVPAGAEVYVLKDIVHDWDDERALAILRTVRTAIPGDGRLLVIERALPPGDAPAPGKLVDITMLLITGGRERTRDEYARLLSRAGFRLDRVAPTAAGTDVLTALPV
jgi:hypothetical protein